MRSGPAITGEAKKRADNTHEPTLLSVAIVKQMFGALGTHGKLALRTSKETTRNAPTIFAARDTHGAAHILVSKTYKIALTIRALCFVGNERAHARRDDGHIGNVSIPVRERACKRSYSTRRGTL